MKFREVEMAIQVVKPSRAEMQKCVARFDDIRGVSEGIPDMKLEEYHRTFYSVIGFEQPKGDEQYSPFGDAVRPVINHMKPGLRRRLCEGYSRPRCTDARARHP
jgi:hypothetical protein